MEVGRGMGAGGSVGAVQATNDDATASKLYAICSPCTHVGLG